MLEPESPDQNGPDPLLRPGDFIGADGSGSPGYQQHQLAGDFESMPVINATPISMVAPEDASTEAEPKVTKRRSMEEMAKKPSWLPDDWRIDLRIRCSGASSGLIDRYFFDPSGRKYRSKHEVLHFLETGMKLKKRKGSGSKRAKKASAVKGQKESKAFKVDQMAFPSDALDNVHVNSPQR